jgi:hypothetical protein
MNLLVTPTPDTSIPTISADGDAKSTAVSRNMIGNTFRAIELEPEVSAEQDFAKFVETLLGKLRGLKEERFFYYENLRKSNARWANVSRRLLASLGAIALVLTSLAAVPADKLQWLPDRALILVVVLAIYAVMGAFSFYEKSTGKTTAYFRDLGIIFTIRDLWTKCQFEFLKEEMALKSATDPKVAEGPARERIRALAEGFCADLNKVTAAEVTEWKNEFLASLSALNEAAKKGSEDVTKQVQENTKTAEKAAADAKAAAEKAAAEAKTATKAAEDAARPGAINFSLSGDYDKEVVISIDGTEVARTHSKTVGVNRLATGTRKISASSMKGAKGIETSRILEIRPGIQDVALTLEPN